LSSIIHITYGDDGAYDDDDDDDDDDVLFVYQRGHFQQDPSQSWGGEEDPIMGVSVSKNTPGRRGSNAPSEGMPPPPPPPPPPPSSVPQRAITNMQQQVDSLATDLVKTMTELVSAKRLLRQQQATIDSLQSDLTGKVGKADSKRAEDEAWRGRVDNLLESLGNEIRGLDKRASMQQDSLSQKATVIDLRQNISMVSQRWIVPLQHIKLLRPYSLDFHHYPPH